MSSGKAKRKSSLPHAKNLPVAVILAGGIGSRLWPLSDSRHPKQFQIFFGKRSLLQSTFDRLAGIFPPRCILVITRADWLGQVKKQLPRLPQGNLIGEPAVRDTAPAIALASLLVRKRFGNPVVGFFPADHWIEPVAPFREMVKAGIKHAQQTPAIFLFGFKPSHPATAYGYLKAGSEVSAQDNKGLKHMELAEFKEKPQADMARKFLQEGGYFWNSGMFMAQTEVFLQEMRRHAPQYLTCLGPLSGKSATIFHRELAAAYKDLLPLSIDYAVMERSRNLRLLCYSQENLRWSDLGEWTALEPFLHGDAAGNRFNCRLQLQDSRNNLIFAQDSAEEISLLGVHDMVVVRSGKRLFMAPKSALPELKNWVQALGGKSGDNRG